jgi:hypothetical protein
LFHSLQAKSRGAIVTHFQVLRHMVEILSIHRKEDLRHARLLAEHVRRKLPAPAPPVTDRTVEKLADLLQEARIDRQIKLARARAEFAADIEAVNAEVARIREIFAAMKAYTEARKVLQRALADRD